MNVNSAGLPRLPAVALEAPAHQQRAGAGQSRDKAQVACGVGVPVRGVVAEAGRGRHVRSGRGVVWLALLLGEKDGRDARGAAQGRGLGRARLGRAGGGGQEDDRVESRACRRRGGGLGYPLDPGSGPRGRKSLYTNISDATRFRCFFCLHAHTALSRRCS